MYIVADIKLSWKLGASQHTPNLSLNSSKGLTGNHLQVLQNQLYKLLVNQTPGI